MTTQSPYRPLIRAKDYGFTSLVVGFTFLALMDFADIKLFNPLVHLFITFAFLALGMQLVTRRSGITTWTLGVVFFIHTLLFARGIYLFGWNIDLVCAIILILGGIFIHMLDEAAGKLRPLR